MRTKRDRWGRGYAAGVLAAGWIAASGVWANPTGPQVITASTNPAGPQVIQGNVQFQGLGTNRLQVINTPGSIIQWQSFSIGAGNVTQFVQQSASSSVLNRVLGADISRIYGQLLSNGRVFLINSAGIVIGAGAVLDTAGFVGSTLRMHDADFLAGKLKFEGDASSGGISNEGVIKVGHGGYIVLAAPKIYNGGILEAHGGHIVLAAGQKAVIGSVELEGVQFEIEARGSVRNIGKLLAENGAVSVFADMLTHSGDVRAQTFTIDDGGRVTLGGGVRWTDFAIGAGELSQFVQQSPSIAVLNRVVGGDISLINAELQSNGRVSLINPAGIVVGGGNVSFVAAEAKAGNGAKIFVSPNPQPAAPIQVSPTLAPAPTPPAAATPPAAVASASARVSAVSTLGARNVAAELAPAALLRVLAPLRFD